MFKFLKKNQSNEILLYNKILSLSRNKLFYTEISMNDTFQNRINLIFLHISFLLNKMKNQNNNALYKNFYQKLFDCTFNKIETNMREIGFGDVSVNQKMKVLVKSFYNILLNSESYKMKTFEDKSKFLSNYLTFVVNKDINYKDLIDYFDKYEAFCFDLKQDSVLKGVLNFNYK